MAKTPVLEESFEQRLKQLRRSHREASDKKVSLETRLTTVKETQAKAEKKLAEKGVDPTKLKAVIASKSDEIDATINEAEKYLPGAVDEDFADDDEDE